MILILILIIELNQDNYFLLLFCFSCFSTAFPAFLKWQHRLWLTLQKFIETRQKLNDNSELKNQTNSEEFLKQEEFYFDCRNYHLKGVNFHFEFTFQFNMLIMKLQGITNQIRVTFFYLNIN